MEDHLRRFLRSGSEFAGVFAECMGVLGGDVLLDFKCHKRIIARRTSKFNRCCSGGEVQGSHTMHAAR